MSNEELIILAAKIEAGTANPQELLRYSAICDLFQKQDVGLADMEAELLEREAAGLRKFWINQNAGSIKGRALWPKIAVAAAAVVALVLGIWFFNSDTGGLKQVQGDVVYKNDIAPGRNTATLTLADGKVINLDTNKSSVVVADSVKAITMLTAATPRGGTYQITLSDGTNVWLNADSKISFPSQFSGKQRSILLVGEAYFEVAKDKVHPFIVRSEGQEVEVLGTHFNINSYSDEPAVKTSLLEGSVKINGSELKPNEQSILTNGQIKIVQIDAMTTIDWKTGEFVFGDEDLGLVMRKIARWYDVEVVFADNNLKNKIVSGSLSRYDNVSRILKSLEFAGDVKFKLIGRKIEVTK